MIKDPNCKNKIYRIHDLDNIIFTEIKKLAVDPQYIDQLKKESEKLEDVQKIHAIEQKIRSIDAQISRFMDLYGLGNYDIDQLDKKTAPLQEQRSKLKKELETLQENSKRITEPEVRKLVENFEDVLEKADLQQTRCIIEQLIDRIIIDGDDITIHWNFI